MLDALTLDQMRVFVAVADSGSFRRAAQRLSRVQSAISHAIANLETQLGVALFDRAGHRPVLTAEGRSLLADARAVLLGVDAMRARARGMGEGVELGLSLVVDTLFPLPAVAAALMQMRRRYPTVAVRVELSPMGGPYLALREGRCDLGIVVGSEFSDPQVEQEALDSFPFLAVVSPAHPLAAMAAGGRLGRRALSGHVQIVLEDPTPLSEGREFGVLSTGTWRVTTQDTKHALIVAGLGWGRLPLWQVERDLAEGRLVRLPVSGLGRDGAVETTAFVARRTDRPFGPAAAALREALLRQPASASTEKLSPAPDTGRSPSRSARPRPRGRQARH